MNKKTLRNIIIGSIILALTITGIVLGIVFYDKKRNKDSLYMRVRSNNKQELVLNDFKCFKFALHGYDGYKIIIRRNNETITYGEFLNLLDGKDMVKILNFCIYNYNAFNAVYFEAPPVTYNELNKKPFEFVIINAPSLNNITEDKHAFKDHFNGNDVVAFDSLGGDARLIVPCPVSGCNKNTFAHLANFIRHAKKKQIASFWSLVGKEMKIKLKKDKNKKVWMSTSGNGVYWLHLRLDDRPKYYNYKEYTK